MDGSFWGICLSLYKKSSLPVKLLPGLPPLEMCVAHMGYVGNDELAGGAEVDGGAIIAMIAPPSTSAPPASSSFPT